MTTAAPLLRVTFRVAASGAVGAGHVARCTAVADALRALGAAVRWVCDPVTVPFLAERGVPEPDILPLRDSATQGHTGEHPAGSSSQRADAAETLAAGRADWHVVDSYAFDAAWHEAVRSSGAHVAVFDDLTDRRIAADLVINAAAGPGTYRDLVPGAREACGLSYGIIGDPGRPAAAGPGSLLIAFGASDAANLTGQTVDAIARGGLRSMPVVVQLGRAAARRADVERQLSALPQAAMAPPGPTSPGSPTLAVGAAGVGLLERMHAGVPSVVVAIADNQRALAAAAERAGAAIVVRTVGQAIDAARQLLESPERLRRMSAAAVDAVDGRAAGRIARMMNRMTGVELRRADMDDARLLYDWRNDPSVRAVSHATDPIPWDAHRQWLQTSLARPDRHVLVAHRHGQPLGTIRLEVAAGCATVSIVVDPARRGAGLGPAMLDAMHAWVPRHDPAVQRLRAEVREGNHASMQAFHAAGYSGGPHAFERPVGRGVEP
jgi:UDP-2,4-diacetamido-2,4,6-trideoxy-beta-L-altropyranose hydrolase